MPFNGSGVYNAPSLPGSWNPAISGQAATPDDWNTLLTDLSTALSTTLTKDGQSTPTNNIKLGGFRLTNVGNAVALTDATTAGQVQNARHTYAIDTGVADAYAIAPLPACSAYAVGQSFQFLATHTSTLTNPTLAVSGLTAGTITWADGSALPVGAIKANGAYEVMVSAVTTGTPTFQLQTPLPISITGPTTQAFTSGSAATYTTPARVKSILVRAWGGGGGGAGCPSSGSTHVVGTAGADTIFNSINAAGGAGGAANTIGGAGGTGGSGAATLRVPGFRGGNGSNPSAGGFMPSGNGGGPAGAAGIVPSMGGNTAGNAAPANSSGGGSGAYNSVGASFNAGAGGGSGEYIEIIINNPSATYTYTVGAGGAGGSSDSNGGSGGSGYILVTEYYNP